MADLQRCESCRGAKMIKGLGMIEKKCDSCNGIGWIEKKDEVIAKRNDENIKPVEIKKRGSRKKSI